MKKMLMAILMAVLFIVTACSASNDSNKEEKQDGKRQRKLGVPLKSIKDFYLSK